MKFKYLLKKILKIFHGVVQMQNMYVKVQEYLQHLIKHLHILKVVVKKLL